MLIAMVLMPLLALAASPAHAAPQLSPEDDSPYQATAGDPVNTYTGDFHRVETDVSITSVQPPLVFSRTFRSFFTNVTSLGPGWMHSYGTYISQADDRGPVYIVVTPDRADFFRPNGDGTFTPDPGVQSALVMHSDGTFVASEPGQGTWYFNGRGSLTKIIDLQGNSTVLDYDPAGQLVTISDPASDVGLSLGYDQVSGRLTSVSVTGQAAPAVTYTYDDQLFLRSVTRDDNDNEVYSYEKTDHTSIQLTQIADDLGNPILNVSYDSQDRVASQQFAEDRAMDDKTTFTYGSNPDGTRLTTVRYAARADDPTWHPIQIDSYDNQARLVEEIWRPTPTKTVTDHRTYDANWNVERSVDVTDHPCQFLFGFGTLHDLAPNVVGDCMGDEQHNPANGDATQQTTTGLLVWRKADNWTAFTDGYHTWINGPHGLQERLNTQRFTWEANPEHLPVAP